MFVRESDKKLVNLMMMWRWSEFSVVTGFQTEPSCKWGVTIVGLGKELEPSWDTLVGVFLFRSECLLQLIRFLIVVQRVTSLSLHNLETMHYCRYWNLSRWVCLHRGRREVVAGLRGNLWGSRKLREVSADDVQFCTWNSKWYLVTNLYPGHPGHAL